MPGTRRALRLRVVAGSVVLALGALVLALGALVQDVLLVPNSASLPNGLTSLAGLPNLLAIGLK